ncbi:S-methyl-5-thioribose kinase [soil metagenome]
MPYSALTTASVLEYVGSITALSDFWGDAGPLTAEEVGDGNLNQVFIVTNARGHKLVLKQALPYLRVAGEGWPLTRERMRFETAALLLYAEVAPDSVPRVHHADPDLSLVVMEYLDGFEVMRGPVTRGQTFPGFAENIGRFMASAHFFTSDAFLNGPAKKAQQQTFTNPQLCKLQEDFVYTNPFMTSPENTWNPALTEEVTAVRQDVGLKIAVNRAKASYLTQAQALLHCDLHTGSIMVAGGETKVIDPEFAFYGPQGYDVGTLFANLVLGAAAQTYHCEDEAARGRYQRYLVGLIGDIWATYTRTFTELWCGRNEGDLSPARFWAFEGGEVGFRRFQEAYLLDVLRDSARHGGCEILRRLMGIVSVHELTSISDDEARAVAERQALSVARAWLTEADGFETVADLVNVVTRALGLSEARS